MEIVELSVEPGQEERLDKYLSGQMAALTRSYIQKLIKDGHILVNQKPVKASYKVEAEDQVHLEIPDNLKPDIEAQDISLDILYEDEHLLVVNKPKGMVVHPAAGHYSHTLVNALLHHCEGQLSGINGILRPGIVHRIDRDTTGSLIVCKSDIAHQHIAAQLKEHSVSRRYRAIVHGCPREEKGTIEGSIGRHPTDRKKMAVNPKNGKLAVTHYRVLEYFADAAYVECVLETGRTHQIRVHMASIGHPLFGDTVYGRAKEKYRLEGQTLHAMTIGFVHPVSGVYIELEAPLPEYFEDLLRKLRL